MREPEVPGIRLRTRDREPVDGQRRDDAAKPVFYCRIDLVDGEIDETRGEPQDQLVELRELRTGDSDRRGVAPDRLV